MKAKRKNYMFGVMLCIFLVSIDQIVKFQAVNYLKDNKSVILIKNVLQLKYVENTGAAFGLFNGQRFWLLIITLIMVFVMGYLYLRIPYRKKNNIIRVMIIIILSGAMGNMIDRILRQYVVDFIYFSLIDFPVFNIADCYVVSGCLVSGVLLMFYYKDSDFKKTEIKD